MKKIINKILFTIFLSVIFIVNAKAEYFSISASPTTVKVGQTVKLTFNFNSYESGLSVRSSDNSVLSGGKEIDWCEGGCDAVYFTAKKAGTATIIVDTKNGVTMDGDNNEQEINFNRTIKITVVANSTPPSVNVNPTYSNNNYLKSLSIDGYNIDFNKDTLEYQLDLEPGQEKINIKAEPEHNKANVKGIGEVIVSEGVNTINVIVTAENGNERIYKLILNVEEKDPINVTVDGKNYRVLKKEELLPLKEGYQKSSVLIDNVEIPALKNDVTGIILVGLKDEDGNIKLFSYDSKSGEYKEYKEISFDLMSLYIHEANNSKYKKKNIKINDQDIIAYQLENIKDYYLLYATNTITGYEGYYLYDIKENSVQRYDTTMLDILTKEKDKYLSLVLVLSSVCFLTMLFLLIEVNRYKNKEV